VIAAVTRPWKSAPTGCDPPLPGSEPVDRSRPPGLTRQMDAAELVATYLNALQASDATTLAGLFTDGGRVHSPLYGVLPAREFFPRLFAVTGESRLTLRAVMQGTRQEGGTVVSFWFHFDWRLPSGAAAPFDVVDLAELDAEGRITDLHLVYDTIDVRPSFEAETGHASWRQSS
jgi:SnoaL-like domain